MLQLSEVAFKATMRSTVVITRDDLRAVGLEPDEIQDIVVGIYAHFAAVSRVFDGHVKYYFAHQLYQEFFTAKFIVNELPMDKFKHLVSNELFFEEKWSVIRRFVCGLLIDMMKGIIRIVVMCILSYDLLLSLFKHENCKISTFLQIPA